jgi:hypothetical protein
MPLFTVRKLHNVELTHCKALEATNIFPDIASQRPDDALNILSNLLKPLSTMGRRMAVKRFVAASPYSVPEGRIQCVASFVNAMRLVGSTPPVLITASLIHQLYRLDRTQETETLIDNLIAALTSFLPSEHPGPSFYCRSGSLQQLPLEITLYIFRFLSPVDMKAFCRSHKAAFRCLYDRSVASRMLEANVIRHDQIGKCSAVALEVLKAAKLPSDRLPGVLISAANEGRLDIVAYYIRRHSFTAETLQPALFAAARLHNADMFTNVFNKLQRVSVINALTICQDMPTFRFPPISDFIRTFNQTEISTFIYNTDASQNVVPLCAIADTLGRTLDQGYVDRIYLALLCEQSVTSMPQQSPPWLQIHQSIEALMSASRFPVSATLVACAERGEEFLERYVQNWPLDRAAVIAALKRQLDIGRESENASIGERFDSNIDFLLAHPERPAWSEILGIFRSLKVDDEAVCLFVDAVESHYDLSMMESQCSSEEYVVLVSKYFPQAATAEFTIKTVSKLLADGENTTDQIPAFLDQNGDGNAPFLIFQ